MSEKIYGIVPPTNLGKGWEATSIPTQQAGDFCRRYLVPASYGYPVRAVAWSRANGDIALIVAEYPNGRRVEVRRQRHDFATTLKWWSPPNFPSPPAGEGDSPKASGVRGSSIQVEIAGAA